MASLGRGHWGPFGPGMSPVNELGARGPSSSFTQHHAELIFFVGREARAHFMWSGVGGQVALVGRGHREMNSSGQCALEGELRGQDGPKGETEVYQEQTIYWWNSIKIKAFIHGKIYNNSWQIS